MTVFGVHLVDFCGGLHLHLTVILLSGCGSIASLIFQLLVMVFP